MGELVGALVEAAVTELLIATDDGHRLAARLGLRLEQLVQALALAILAGAVVPGDEHLVLLGLAQHPHLPDGPLAIGQQPIQQPLEVPAQPLDGRLVEQPPLVTERPSQAPAAVFPQRQGQVELRRLRLRRHPPQPQPPQPQLLPRRVLPHQHHLEQRRPTQLPLRLQLLDQLLERHLLMRVGSQRHLPHPPQHLDEARLAAQPRPQHQRVDEEADQPFRLAAVAPRDRRPHDDV